MIKKSEHVSKCVFRELVVTVTLRGLPERRKLAHIGCSEPAYNRIYLDGHPSKSTAYMNLHPHGDPSRGFLKDGGLLMLDACSQLIKGYTLIVARAGQLPIWVFTLTATLRVAS